ncbi:hypothetical protein ACEV60_20480 [Enterobacter ludwigii]|uniref:hypothetical protein n=1 Tax=Enterobacter TaxID=547 RepID=UPI0009BAE512|nr:hypothetical protein [Enterobacter ludwigii]
MSNTNANFEMTGILLGQKARKRKTPQEKIAIIQQTMEPGMNVSHVARLCVFRSVRSCFRVERRSAIRLKT